MTFRWARTILLTALYGFGAAAPAGAQRRPVDAPDTAQIRAVAALLAADSLKGRGPWSPEGRRVAEYLATELRRLGAIPAVGNSLLVPFTAEPHPTDTVFNVVGIIPARRGSNDSLLVGISSHYDHLGIDSADARGDSIYNGFLDDAIGTAMVLDVARRYAASPGDRGLLVMLFDLEEQGLLGSYGLIQDRRSHPALRRLTGVIGVDAGAPAGEATAWELMGGAPPHRLGVIADSLAQARGWTLRATPPRAISDVFLFSRLGIPILFPIPGATWRGYSKEARDSAMTRFDHYHQPSDSADRAFPMTGTWHFADWLFSIVRDASRGPTPAR